MIELLGETDLEHLLASGGCPPTEPLKTPKVRWADAHRSTAGLFARLHLRQMHVGRKRCGFTMVELLTVGALMAFVAALACQAWSGLGDPAVEVYARCRVAQEANLAVAALARDFAGSLADDPAGTKEAGRSVGRLIVNCSELRLCFDGGSPPNAQADWANPDTIVSYTVESNQLVRTNLATARRVTLARDVQSMVLSPVVKGVQIRLTFAYRKITRTYTIVGKDP